MAAVSTTPRFAFRGRELLLLLFPFALMGLGFYVLGQLDNESVVAVRLWPALAFLGMGLLAHLLLSALAPDADQMLLPITLTLTAVGLVMIERLASNFTVRQVMSLGIGLIFCLAIAIWPHTLRVIERFRYSLVLPGIVLLLLAVLVSLTPFGGGGLSLFLTIGSLGLQPSEMLKVLLIIFIAGYLDFHREKFISFRLTDLTSYQRWLWVYFPMLSMWGFAMLLLVWQRDMGAALLFFGSFLALVYMATQRADYVAIGLTLFVGGATVAASLFSHVQERIAIWQNPWELQVGYQVRQALLAVANGGLLGQGLGQGRPDFVPVVHSDFITVAIAEEWGLAGLLAVVALFLLFMLRGFDLALRGRESFRQLLAGGLTSLVCLQAFIMMAGTLKLMPVTGITLPYVSYGGSSLMTMYALLGLLLRLSREAER